MSNVNTPKIPKLVSHAQYVVWCCAVEDAILAAGVHASLREKISEPIRPVTTETLPVTAAHLQVYVAELAYYRSWKDKDEKARGVLFEDVSNGLRMKLQGCTTAREAWEKLAQPHQLDYEDYRADIRNQLSTIVMTAADDPETLVERYETPLMTAQVAGLDVTEAAKCSDFFRAWPASFDNLRSEWRTQCKFAKAEEDKNFDALSQLFNTRVLQSTRYKAQDRPAVKFAGRQGRQHDSRECWNCDGKGHFSTRCPKPKIGDGRKH
ncbi:hypothetical protein QFC21_006341 [Naganishia friedmannii]|uniref:Uncharacterized protein n=1 Tax=Naganishia friedmannii TaxID=89922 RepID=A0ACC2V328_9TREE|nr:hypothetical protein QFC21_006341 [Naganishia friedmannii]